MPAIRVRSPSKHPQHLWFKVGITLVVLLVFMAIFTSYRSGVGRAIFIGNISELYTGETVDLTKEQFITFVVLPDEKGYIIPLFTRNGPEPGVLGFAEYSLDFTLQELDAPTYIFSLCSLGTCLARDVISPDESISLYLDPNDPLPDLEVSFLEGKITLATLHPVTATYHQFYGKVNGLPATGGPFNLFATLYNAANEKVGDQGVIVQGDGTYGYGAAPLKLSGGENGWRVVFKLLYQNGTEIASLGGAAYSSGSITTLNFQVPGTAPLPLPTATTVDLRAAVQGGIASAGPLTIQSGSTITFSWTSGNANSCTASNTASSTASNPAWTGSKATSGTEQLAVTANGMYTLTCSGAGGSASDAVSVFLAGQPVPPPEQPGPGSTPTPAALDFSLSDVEDKSVINGSSVTTNVSTLLVSGTAQNVTFNVSNLPAGITASFAPALCLLPCLSQLTLSASPTLALGEYKIQVNATAAGSVKTTKFDLHVYAPLDFTLSSAGDKSATIGTTTNTTITLQLAGGTPQPVSFFSAGFPSGTSALFNPTSCLPPCTTTLSFTPSILAAAGLYNVAVRAKGAEVTKTTNFTLQLTKAAATCQQDWLCGDWTACIANLQSRSCNRNDQCDKFIGTNTQIIPATKPETQRICQGPPPPVTPPTPAPLLCSPGTKQCSGNQLQQCNYDGKSWTIMESCTESCDSLALACRSVPPTKPQKPFLIFPTWSLYLAGSLAVFAVIIILLLSLLSRKKFAPAKEYIEESRSKGYSDQQIRGRLISEGWEAKKIDKLLK
ncbi:MAG: hypothetical protein AABX13_03380 [Nanoarchaeota archaeon]